MLDRVQPASRKASAVRGEQPSKVRRRFEPQPDRLKLLWWKRLLNLTHLNQPPSGARLLAVAIDALARAHRPPEGEHARPTARGCNTGTPPV
eukprot:scaffold38353_cov31-Tisochrysis_lutea.AAC.5